jgi:hypothetical protein
MVREFAQMKNWQGGPSPPLVTTSSAYDISYTANLGIISGENFLF